MVIPFRFYAVAALLPGLLQICNAQAAPANAIVSGHVYYENGNPVEGAVVDFKCFCALSGMLPPPTHTDKQGAFTLTHATWGEGWLTASKESEGFPDAVNALYGRSSPSYVKVDLKEGAVFSGVDLHFPAPRPFLKLRVVDKASSLPLPDARVVIAWPDDPQIMLSTSPGSDGTFQFVLPNHPVSITVSAGRSIWRYRDQKTGALFLETAASPVDITVHLVTP